MHNMCTLSKSCVIKTDNSQFDILMVISDIFRGGNIGRPIISDISSSNLRAHVVENNKVTLHK